jgi:Family of unknown function (DUF5691)
MDELTKIALLGTSKYAGPIPSGDHPAALPAAACSPGDREECLLLACGAQAVYALAGRCSEAGINPSVPATEETKKAASRKLAALLEGAAAERQDALLLEFLRQMHAHAVVLPPDLLPRLLEFKDAEIRKSVIPVLGERGAWLCRLNPDWAQVLADADDHAHAHLEALRRTWEEGTIDERCRTIETLRGSDPDRAREWVEEALSKEKHGNRVKLLKSLTIGLNDSDEPFLEQCLDDRSPAVVQVAASLLCELPSSALAGRMLSRAALILTLEKQGPGVLEAKLVCTPPEDFGPDWERDGIKKKAAESVGPRAFWTEQLVSSVPPSHWPKQFGLEPQALIRALADDTFAGSVISGWTTAVYRFAKIDPASVEWLEPLWDYHVESLGRVQNRVILGVQFQDRAGAINRIERLLYFMPPDVAESALAKVLKPAPGWQDGEALAMLSSWSRWSRAWSVQFAKRFLATARARLERGTDESAFHWAAALPENACALPPETLSLALAPWKTADSENSATWFTAAIRKEISKFATVIEKRQSFLKELDA